MGISRGHDPVKEDDSYDLLKDWHRTYGLDRYSNKDKAALVSGIEEIRQANSLLDECEAELRAEGTPIRE